MKNTPVKFAYLLTV